MGRDCTSSSSSQQGNKTTSTFFFTTNKYYVSQGQQLSREGDSFIIDKYFWGFHSQRKGRFSLFYRDNRSRKERERMNLRGFTLFSVFTIVLFTLFSLPQAYADGKYEDQSFKPASPFSQALDTLQKQIGYTFKNIGLLRGAMTHASFSEENNNALSILGTHVIETSASMHYLEKDIDMSSKELNNFVMEISNVDSSCSVDGKRLGLQKVVRVSPKTDPSIPSVVCGAFRAMFGAIAIDSGNIDEAVNMFWSVHSGKVGRAASF